VDEGLTNFLHLSSFCRTKQCSRLQHFWSLWVSELCADSNLQDGIQLWLLRSWFSWPNGEQPKEFDADDAGI